MCLPPPLFLQPFHSLTLSFFFIPRLASPLDPQADPRNGAFGFANAEPGQWVLEEYSHEGRPYLLDRANWHVYQGGEAWPQLVGRLAAGGRLELAPGNRDFFAALDEHLKAR